MNVIVIFTAYVLILKFVANTKTVVFWGKKKKATKVYFHCDSFVCVILQL